MILSEKWKYLKIFQNNKNVSFTALILIKGMDLDWEKQLFTVKFLNT